MANLKHPLKLKQKYIRLDERSRLYGLSLPLIGLTGGIASGKSTVSNMLRNRGFHIIDADALIHNIYKEKDTIAFIRSCCPEAVHKNEISFKKLREAFFNDKELKANIEQYLYKKLPAAFMLEVKVSPYDYIIYDVPLLFEKQIDVLCDTTIAVYTTRENQSKRLKLRDNLEDSLVTKILESQLDIELKKAQSDSVIDNNHDLIQLESQIQLLTNDLFE
jgi:dephospho-CoA kinase